MIYAYKSSFSKGLRLAAAWFGLASPVLAQPSAELLRQQTFEFAGDQWPMVRAAMESSGHLPLTHSIVTYLAPDADSLSLLMGRWDLRAGEQAAWWLCPDALPSTLDWGTPEIWQDGTLIGTGWNLPIPWTAPIGASLSCFELRIPSGSDTLKASTTLPVKTLCVPPTPDLPPWPFATAENPWWVDCLHDGEVISGMAVTLLSPDAVFDHPLLVVEGFDPNLNDTSPSYGFGTMNWDAIWNCADLAYPNTASMAQLLDTLVVSGFDLIYLDFEDGTRSAESQASLVGEVLDRISETVVGEGQIAVVGASMGGAIARLALRQREIEGSPDCVHQFVTLDTPHQGAYLPLSMQEALAFFATQDAQAANLHAALNSPAARELLLLTPDGALPEHLALIESLQTLGWPQVPECLAISNGHPSFTLDPQGAPLLQGTVSSWGVDWAQIQLWPLPGNPFHSESSGAANVVFDCSLPNFDGSWWQEPVVEATAWCSPSAYAWESVPASKSPHIQALSSALEAQGFDLNGSANWTAYVPVQSALDVGTASARATRMEPVGSAPAAHCDLTGHVDFLIDWILQGAQLTGPSIGDAMGFEHWGHLHPHRKMMAGALLGNGSHWTIGTPSGNGGWGTDWPHFEVRLAPCTAPLVIGSGGALSVGEPSGQGTGTLRVTRGNTLELHSEGMLHIGKGSQLIVEAGASLKIEGSGLLLEAGSLLTVLPGGSLVFTGTSEVQLQAPSLFSLLGTMTAAPAATITVSALDGAEVHLAGECTLSSGSEWRLQGSSALAFPLFVDSSWACSGAGGVRWEHLICTLGVDVNVDLGATQRWDDVEIWPESSSYVNSTARWRWEGGSANRLIVHHNHMASADPFWVDVTLDECQITTEFSSPKILDCAFNQSNWHALFAENSEWSGCVFNGNGSGTGLHLTHCFGTNRLRDTGFANWHDGMEISASNAYLECSEWIHNDNGLRLSDGASATINGGMGGYNEFSMNVHHAVWEASPWWACEGGRNHFDSSSGAAFVGTVDCSVLTLPASGNSWSDGIGFNFQGLASLDGAPLALSTLPELLGPVNCSGTTSAPGPMASGPKSLWNQRNGILIWHPTIAESGTLKLWDLAGRPMGQWEVPRGAKEVVCEVGELATGRYYMEWMPADGGVGREVVGIWLQ